VYERLTNEGDLPNLLVTQTSELPRMPQLVQWTFGSEPKGFPAILPAKPFFLAAVSQTAGV